MHDVLGGTPLLISMTDVAELAGVHRPVVSNWRRRHPDFPDPAGDGATRPLFDAREVCDWLVATGRAERARVEPDLCLYAVEAFAATLPPRELIAAATALLCMRHLDDDPLTGATAVELRARARAVDPHDQLLFAEIAAVPMGVLPGLVDDLVEAAWGCRGAFERILSVRGRLAARTLTASAVDAELVRLIAGLSGVVEHAPHAASLVIADPAAGAGDLLAGLVRDLPESCTPIVVAADEDPYLVRLLRRRLAVAGLPEEDRDVRAGVSTETLGPDPDVIVTQLPYRPAESRSASDVLHRIDDIAVGLAPGRTAVVLGPADVLAGDLSRFSGPERARAALLAGGMVEAVIRLPGGLVPFRPGYETALWVVTSAHGSPLRGRVLLGDVSGRPLTPEVVDALVTDVVTWRRSGHRPEAHTRRFCVQADVAALVDAPGPLVAPRLPSMRERTTQVPASVARVAELESALSEPAVAPRPAVRTAVVQAPPVAPRSVGLRALVRAGRVLVVPGSLIDPGDVIVDGSYRLVGPAELAGGPGHRSIDRVLLADRYPRAQLTEPGDVLLTLSPAPVAVVDHVGLAVVEYPARVLRIPASERQLLTPRVLAALLQAGAAPRTGRAVRASRRLLGLEVPVLTPDAVRHLDAVLARLDERRAAAQRELDTIEEITAIMTSGLADATLTFRP